MKDTLNHFHLITVGTTGELGLWLPWVGPVLLCLLALWVLAPVWRRRRQARRERRSIERLASACVRDAVLPNGMDGMTQVDYLLLTPNGIVVADVKRYQGYLFGGEHIEQWTQIIDNRSYKFPNPLFKNEMDVMAVRERAAGVPVSGWVIFAGEGSFPKGRPERVALLETLADDLGLTNEAPTSRTGTSGQAVSRAPEAVQGAIGVAANPSLAAWEALQHALTTGTPGRAGRMPSWRTLAAVLLLALALAWGGWLAQARGVFHPVVSSAS